MSGRGIVVIGNRKRGVVGNVGEGGAKVERNVKC